jgi:hypothetical protein
MEIAENMESIQKDDPNPEMSEWVEELERQRALFGERVIYVSAQLFGSALRATGFLPQVDGRELRFRLLPQTSPAYFPLEMSVFLPLHSTDAEFEIYRDSKGILGFEATIWLNGLMGEEQTIVRFSESLEIVMFAEYEPPQQ